MRHWSFNTGSDLGISVGLPLCAYLTDWYGWEMVFYFSGFIGFAWTITWYTFCYDSPLKHPNISKVNTLL